MTDKLDQYTDVITRLLRETIACTPDSWDKGILTIDSDGTHINYKLKNEGHPENAAISEKLRDLIDELYVRMAHNGDVWTAAKISFSHETAGLKYNIDFQYTHSEKAEILKRPWWKFWGNQA